MTTTCTVEPGRIRWMIRRDTPEVLAIDAARYPDAPLTDESLCAVLREYSQIGMVYDDGQRVLGYMIYRLEKRCIRLLRMAVAPEARGRHVAEMMLNKLKGKLTGRRQALLVDVPEADLDRQIYLRWAGFRCRQVLGAIYRFSFLALDS